jgi:hypothetical protein
VPALTPVSVRLNTPVVLLYSTPSVPLKSVNAMPPLPPAPASADVKSTELLLPLIVITLPAKLSV